jgi:hypothetical protein
MENHSFDSVNLELSSIIIDLVVDGITPDQSFNNLSTRMFEIRDSLADFEKSQSGVIYRKLQTLQDHMNQYEGCFPQIVNTEE